MTTELKRLIALLGQSVLGLAILLFSDDILHDELFRPNRSLWVIGGAAAGVFLGALIVPGASPLITEGAQKGFLLFKEGRRATDVKLTEIELPPPENKP